MKSKLVKHVSARVKCLGKGKRKWIVRTVEASADTIEEACYLLVPRYVHFLEGLRAYEILSVDCVDATETDYGCDFGPMISVPLFRECASSYRALTWDEVVSLGINAGLAKV